MQNIFSRIFIRIFPADLKEELEKEKESQNAIRKRIEEETKTTGGEDIIFVFVFVLAFLVMFTHICVDAPIIDERRVKVRSGLTKVGTVA